MYQTLFYIPDKLFGFPLFGAGLLLAIWGIASVGVLLWHVRRRGFDRETLGYLPLLALIGAAIYWLLPWLLQHAPSGESRGLPVRGYGVMLLLGVAGAVALGAYRAKRRGIDPEVIYSLAIWLLVGGFAGARVFYVVEYWNQQFYQRTADGGFDFWSTLAAVLNFPGGGLVVYGSFVGGAVATIWFLRRNRLPVLRLLDVIAPSVMLGLAVGRIGCFLNGCCFGGISDVPWAVSFPQSSPPFQRQLSQAELDLHGLAFHDAPDEAASQSPAVIYSVKSGSPAARAGLKAGDRIVEIVKQSASDAEPQRLFPKEYPGRNHLETARADYSLAAAEMALLEISGEGTRILIRTAEGSEPVGWTVTAADEPPVGSRPTQPTQLYGTIDALLLCLLLLAFEPFRRLDGETFALMATLHPIARFLLEAVRVDEPKKFIGLSISQVGSLIFLGIAAALWCYLLMRRPAGSTTAAARVSGAGPA